MGNVSKRQQPDQRADNSRKPPMGLQCSEKLPHQEATFYIDQSCSDNIELNIMLKGD